MKEKKRDKFIMNATEHHKLTIAIAQLSFRLIKKKNSHTKAY